MFSDRGIHSTLEEFALRDRFSGAHLIWHDNIVIKYLIGRYSIHVTMPR